MKIKCTFHIAIAFILIQLTDEFSIASVSYTHLTLPTNSLV